MEWLSNEEKSRSMMPYLLNLPPLDTEAEKDVEKEIVKPKSKNAQKVEKPEVELEKWHSVNPGDIVDLAENNICSTPTRNRTNCDITQKFKYDCKKSNFKKFIDLNEKDMEVLRALSQNKKLAQVRSKSQLVVNKLM